VERGPVVTLHGPVRLKSVDVLADLAPSDDTKKGTIEHLDTAGAPIDIAGHGFRWLPLNAPCARRTLVKPRLGRDADRTVLVDPPVLVEARAIRLPRVTTYRVLVGGVLARTSRSTQRSIRFTAAGVVEALDGVSSRGPLLSDPQALTVATRISTAQKTRTLELYDG